MKMTPESLNCINEFTKYPDHWLLQAQKVKGEVSVHLMKKGFWTWLKINVAGRIGLFDRSTVKVQHIAGLLDQIDTLPKEFQERWAAKKQHFEAKHFPLFQSRTENKQSVSLNIRESNAKISSNVINHLNVRDIFSSVHVNDLDGGGKDVSIRLSPPLWRSLDKEKTPVNSALILDRILTGKGDHYEEECLKMIKMGYRLIHVQLLPQQDGTIRAVISAD